MVEGTAYDRAKRFSEATLGELRQAIVGMVPEKDVVLACGSYARREASAGSDIDYFIITQSPRTSELDWAPPVKAAINGIVPVEPAEGGAFSKVEQYGEMLTNIGGDADANQKLTRRMLFLLEGEWLFNEEGLRQVRRAILERYIKPTITDHQLSLFLLNDIIRYYRTIAVDYEFKTTEGEKPKPWGIRNIKLVFSRKLLYASGLFSVAVTADLRYEHKIEALERLFVLSPIDRMIEICGEGNFRRVLDRYDRFLERIEDPATRDHLKALEKDNRTDPVFRDLKNEGHHFTRELFRLFENTFDSTHPIRRAVTF